jgi:hypothetical protein
MIKKTIFGISVLYGGKSGVISRVWSLALRMTINTPLPYYIKKKKKKKYIYIPPYIVYNKYTPLKVCHLRILRNSRNSRKSLLNPKIKK